MLLDLHKSLVEIKTLTQVFFAARRELPLGVGQDLLQMLRHQSLSYTKEQNSTKPPIANFLAITNRLRILAIFGLIPAAPPSRRLTPSTIFLGGASEVVRDKDGSYRNEDEESDGDWWITEGVYYHMENELVYRYNFSGRIRQPMSNWS